jgi:hypothetical protein
MSAINRVNETLEKKLSEPRKMETPQPAPAPQTQSEEEKYTPPPPAKLRARSPFS